MTDARAPILFAATDYGAAGSADATIELRGSTSRTAIQKSYQIKLAAGRRRPGAARARSTCSSILSI